MCCCSCAADRGGLPLLFPLGLPDCARLLFGLAPSVSVRWRATGAVPGAERNVDRWGTKPYGRTGLPQLLDCSDNPSPRRRNRVVVVSFDHLVCAQEQR
jgi:hypothetical protein